MNRNYAGTKDNPLSISELTDRVKRSLEQFPRMYLVGEISNYTRASSGHWYFSLKDNKSQIRCNMWRSSTSNVAFRPKDGTQVLVSGTLNVYAPRGEYSLVCDSMEEMGKGQLRLAFERLKAKLGAEGLFDPSHKKPLPLLPRKIGVVTSPTGAAIRDILRVLHNRFAGVQVLIFPARVQGEDASAEIALGLRYLDAACDCDVIIAGRGGGSEEDLWAFNEEIVARAIFACKTPVISAVGHEVDFTIADFVADVRAATPSHAAEMAIRSRLEYHKTLQIHQRTMERAMDRLLLRLRNRVNISESHPIFVRVRNRVNNYQRRMDEAQYQLNRLISRHLTTRKERLMRTSATLSPRRLSQRVAKLSNRLTVASGSMESRIHTLYESLLHRVATLSYRLEDLSPLKILNRGYAAVYNARKKLVRSPEDVSTGEILTVRVAQGQIKARVIEEELPIQGSLFGSDHE